MAAGVPQPIATRGASIVTAVLLLVITIPFVRGRMRRSLATKLAAPAVAAGLAASVPAAAAAEAAHTPSEKDEAAAKPSAPQRVFAPAASVLTALSSSEDQKESATTHAMPGDAEPELIEARRALVRGAATSGTLQVPLPLWIAYRSFVDTVISARAGRAESFHSFVYAHALGLASPDLIKAALSGSDAADLLACLADAGLLTLLPARTKRRSIGGRGSVPAAPSDGAPRSAEAALVEWLGHSLEAFDARFNMAREREYDGLTHDVEGGWQGEYDFVQLADPQLGMLHFDRDWSEELTMLRLAIQHVNRLKPRFVVVSGDLINAFPTVENEGVAARQVAAFKEALHELSPSIPLILQPGNHDIGQQPTPADIARYRERFGDDYFEFWVGGVLYVALNSQYYRDDAATLGLRAKQDAWADATFARARELGAKHVVVLSHVPPFVGAEGEPAGWANWQLEHRAAMLRRAEEAGAKLWLAGHYHGNAVATSRGGIEVVTTSACGGVINWTESAAHVATQPFPDFKKVVGSPPVVADARHSGMRLVRVSESGFSHRWFELADVPRTLAEAFEKKRWAKVKDRYWNMADVMGLSNRQKAPRRPMRSQSLAVGMTGGGRPPACADDDLASSASAALSSSGAPPHASLDAALGSDDVDSGDGGPPSPSKPSMVHAASTPAAVGRKNSLAAGRKSLAKQREASLAAHEEQAE